MANEKNLKPIKKGELTSEEAKKRGSNGGKKSVQARREKKLLSEIYAEVLAELHDIKCKKGESAKEIIKDIIGQRNASSVSMLKEVREATEGSKHSIDLTSTEEASKEIKEIFGAALKNNNDK